MAKEIDLARRFVEAIAAPFNPEEFTDRYREQLESLIASKQTLPSRAATETARPAVGNVVDIMDALRKSLEKVKVKKTVRKPLMTAGAPAKRRKRRA
jgi:DNA end-binding protein Ku